MRLSAVPPIAGLLQQVRAARPLGSRPNALHPRKNARRRAASRLGAGPGVTFDEGIQRPGALRQEGKRFSSRGCVHDLNFDTVMVRLSRYDHSNLRAGRQS
jgi:hypothetical protein